ncbi:MAG: hypothetical protein KAQ74_02520, partial [Dehalococcoidia bacterium]|nr:hypothetical protein [Dehalococcoidia bacterium]
QQKRMAERLYSQLGLDPVVEKVLKEYKGSLKGVDRATDTVFGPFDIKGRAESVAKVASLMTYSALHQQYTTELGQMQEQIDHVEGEKNRERANYDTLVQKVADVVGGDYEELKSNYDEVVDRLSTVEHLKTQTLVLNTEKAELVRMHEAQLATLQTEKAETAGRYETQIAAVQIDKAETVGRYEVQLEALRKEFAAAADDLRAQVAERGKRIGVLEEEKAAVLAEKSELDNQLEELKKAHAGLESRHTDLSVRHEKLRAAASSLDTSVDFSELRKRMGLEMHKFVLDDSKVPDAVIDGVGKFIDIKKYMGHAAESGARDAVKQASGSLGALP